MRTFQCWKKAQKMMAKFASASARGSSPRRNVLTTRGRIEVVLEEQHERFPLVYAAGPYFAGNRDDAFDLGVRLLVSTLRDDFAGSSGKSGRGTPRSSGPSRAPPAR